MLGEARLRDAVVYLAGIEVLRGIGHEPRYAADPRATVASGDTDPIRVATTGVFEFDCPSGTFQGAGVKTVVLFFEKGAPTRKVWYYQLDPGRNLGKTNPLNDNDMAEFVESNERDVAITRVAGGEIFVVAGSFADEHGSYRKGTPEVAPAGGPA